MVLGYLEVSPAAEERHVLYLRYSIILRGFFFIIYPQQPTANVHSFYIQIINRTAIESVEVLGLSYHSS